MYPSYHDDDSEPEPGDLTRYNGTQPVPGDQPADTLRWRASGYSNGAGGMCVQVAQVRTGDGKGGFLVRDSKDPDGAVLAFSKREWIAFLDDADSFRGERV
jgi:hypothetical protein